MFYFLLKQEDRKNPYGTWQCKLSIVILKSFLYRNRYLTHLQNRSNLRMIATLQRDNEKYSKQIDALLKINALGDVTPMSEERSAYLEKEAAKDSWRYPENGDTMPESTIFGMPDSDFITDNSIRNRQIRNYSLNLKEARLAAITAMRNNVGVTC